MLGRITTLIVSILLRLSICAQDSSSNILQQIPSQYLDKVSSKARRLEGILDKKSEKALLQMFRLESKIKAKLFRKDSFLASTVFGDADAKYKHLEEKLKTPRQQLGNLCFVKQLKKINKQVFYYSQPIAESKDIFRDLLSNVKNICSKESQLFLCYLQERKD